MRPAFSAAAVFVFFFGAIPGFAAPDTELDALLKKGSAAVVNQTHALSGLYALESSTTRTGRTKSGDRLQGVPGALDSSVHWVDSGDQLPLLERTVLRPGPAAGVPGDDFPNVIAFARLGDSHPSASRSGTWIGSPTAPLALLLPTEMSRIEWSLGGCYRQRCHLEFRETKSPSLWRTTANGDVPARGGFTLDEETGEVVDVGLTATTDPTMAAAISGGAEAPRGQRFRYDVVVQFGRVEGFEHRVPTAMVEMYDESPAPTSDELSQLYQAKPSGREQVDASFSRVTLASRVEYRDYSLTPR